MHYTSIVLVASSILVLTSSLSAQSLSMVLKAGVSDYDAVEWIGHAGGVGGGDRNWSQGRILGLGVRYRATDALSIQGVLDYVAHRYSPKFWEPTPINDPWNRIIEFHAIANLSIKVYKSVYFDFLTGLGLSYQDVEEILQEWSSYRTKRDAYSRTLVSGVIGVALEYRISRRVEVALEGSWHVRFYVSPVVQLGVFYMICDC